MVNNVDVASPEDPAAIADALLRQLYRPVRWVEIITRFAEDGIGRVIECGPGRVLAGLGRRIAKTLEHGALETPDSMAELIRGNS